MAHNFKRIIDGARYISKSGHDSNDGATPDTPVRTIDDRFVYDPLVIGAGHYTEGNWTAANYRRMLYGDGKVILDGILNSINNYQQGNNPNVNIEFRNMVIVSRQSTLGNLIAKNCRLSGYVTSGTIEHSIAIDSEFFMNGDDSMNVSKSILIRCWGETEYIFNSYVDKSTEITFKTDRIAIEYSNFRGVAVLKGIYFSDGVAKKYAVQDQLTGTPQDNGYATGVKWFTTANLQADGYTGTKLTFMGTYDMVSSINRSPLFNNESIEDFTLQAGSPHIGRASDGTNIGGTNVSLSTINTDNGTGTIEVIPSSTIDTTTDAWKVKAGETEGYIDYIQKIGESNLLIREISPISALEFNADIQGGQTGNKNVPDSEPLTYDYPRKLTTTSLAADALTLNVTGHNAVVGEWVRVLGEDREVTAVTADTITLSLALRAAAPSGTTFQISAKHNIGALRPNRLTYQMRTSKEDNKPSLDSQWDNDIDPIYNKAGAFLTQEWDQIPGYYIDIDNNAVWGSGDSETPAGLIKNEISAKWIHIRVYIRNNYES